MAEEYDLVSVDQLDTVVKLAVEQYLSVANVNGKLFKSRIGDVITFITPFIKAVSGSGLVFPDISNVLPDPTSTVKASIVGAGTFTWTGGTLTTTSLLNIIATNGTSWVLVKAINTGDLISRSEYIFGGKYATVAAANLAIPNTEINGVNQRERKRVDIGSNGSYIPYWWNGGTADVNLQPMVDFLKRLYEFNLFANSYQDKFIISDTNGKALFQVDKDLVSYIGQVKQADVNSKLPIADFVTKLIENNVNNTLLPDGFVIADKDGKILFSVTNNEVKYVNQVSNARVESLEASPVLRDSLDLYQEEFIVANKAGEVYFRTGPNGTFFVGADSGASSGAVVLKRGIYDAEIMQLIVYGQSLAQGGTIYSSIDFYDGKTFTGGILTEYDPADAAAKSAYYGTALVDLPTIGIDSGKPMTKIIKELIASENGIPINIITDASGLKYDNSQQVQFLTNSPGAGGLPYSMMADVNGIYYKRLIESVKFANDYAIANGKTFSVPILCYIQGENSNDKDDSLIEFYNKLDTLFIMLNSDIKAITNQAYDVQFINYQIASFAKNPPGTANVGLAQLKLTQDRANVHFGTSMYQEDYYDSLHWTAESARVCFARMGVVAKRAIVDKVKMLPILPSAWTIQKDTAGTKWIINMKFHVEVKPLVFDTTVNSKYLTIPAHYGFSILNGSGVEIITDVTIKQGETINISCSQNPAGFELTYAIGGTSSGGNLRDSQGDKIKISASGVNRRVDNWAPFFKQII